MMAQKYYLPRLIILIGFLLNSLCFASDDPVSSFKAGEAKLEERKADIFGRPDVAITYNVIKTDSLLNPMVGIVRVKYSPGNVSIIEEFQFSYGDRKWAV